MRLFVSVIATSAMLLAASVAGAVEFNVLNGPGIVLQVGQTVDVGITLRNADLTEVQSIGASVHGYDEGVADFVEGRAVGLFLNTICPAPGTCFGGMPNLVGPDLEESSIGGNGNRVSFVTSAVLSPNSNDGSIDQGLDFLTGTAQFRLTFEALSIGVTTLLVGTGYEGDGIVIPDGSVVSGSGDTFTITVVPEPGTALLMGLGLAALAHKRGRRA